MNDKIIKPDSNLPGNYNNSNPSDNGFAADFKRRISEIRTTRWIRFSIVALIFILWVIWLGNWWVILFLPLLFDIYITGYIPFTWWKKSKNKNLVMVMSWVDAIVYALILVYFAFSFIGQNYQIPSPSLEKTLMTGDYLWVSKVSYGPRVPMTPIHFPLVQNTFPILNSKSYTDNPQLPYHRLKGLGEIEVGDIVVFNFPAGDSVVVNQQNPDYHSLKKMIGDEIIAHDAQSASVFNSLPKYEAALYRDELGKNYMLSLPSEFGELLYRPVDRRENYVKRCVGLPGDTLKIVDGQIYVNGRKQPWPEEAQFNYIFQTTIPLSEDDWEELGVSVDDRHLLQQSYTEAQLLAQGFKTNGSMYWVPLTNAMVEKVKKLPGFVNIIREPDRENEYLFPDFISQSWTRSNYGPVYIPRKGQTVELTAENWPMYERIIRNYENHPDSYVKGSTVYIDGKPTTSYTFEMDYYFMMGDNRDNSLDSRYWGFVPEDHIVGKPIRVLISFDKDKSIFNGGIRWNRIFKDANPGF
ncbi:MAG: signal peptidase I [Bacteroides sp.]|nr:signal peptidase I [Bacteroides sp.]MCM1413741.1 signal peptidase I [Bacteroides sp.]MCM1472240.1 signal peptidase I [Bacteroides sp.]